MADETPKPEVKPEVKISASSNPEPAPPVPTPPTSAAPPQAPKSEEATGESSNHGNGTQKLLSEALERENRLRDQKEKLEMRLAQEAETRNRLRRVFKPGFKMAKQR